MPVMLLQTALVSACLLVIPLNGQTSMASAQSRPSWTEPAEKSPTVSADLLRHPISSGTRRMLQRAFDWMRSGKHQEAIQQLETTLSKDPSSAPYVHSLLGYEYMQTEQFTAAVYCFEQAVSLLPHEPTNHHNFAVSLAVIGDFERAEEEARRAHDLAPDNPDIQRFLDALRASAKSRGGTLNAQGRKD